MEIMRLKGINGTIIAYDDKVVIERSGFFAWASFSGSKGDKTYFYSSLSSIGYKKPSLTNGYFQFIVAGSNPSAPKFEGLMHVATKETREDENLVLLSGYMNPADADQLYEILIKKVLDAKSSNSGQGSPSGADEIKKYSDLYKQGIISEEEFTAAKKKILGI